MDRRRVIILILLIIGISLFIWIQFFEMPKKVQIGEEKMQQDPLTHKFEEVTQFASPYMGDASNMNALLEALPFNQFKQSIEMDEDSYTLKAHYTTDQMKEEQIEQVIVYNSTALFSLVGNLQQIEWGIDHKGYTVTRDRVEKWFGRTLVDFKDPETFTEKVQQQLQDDLPTWFAAYIESE